MKPEDAKFVKGSEDWGDVEFEATLKIVGTMRGRSSAVFTAVDEEKRLKYQIFISDLLDMIVDDKIKKGGILKGTFCVTKKGTNFGIRLKDTKKQPKLRYFDFDQPIPDYYTS